MDITAANPETYLAMYRADPETLPGAPSNEAIIAKYPELQKSNKPLTSGERLGFLEMWQLAEVPETILGLDDHSLASLTDSAGKELAAIVSTERRIADLRRIHTAARNELSRRSHNISTKEE